MKIPFRVALGVTLCIFLSSCIVTSDNPLSPPEAAQTDPRLLGDWIGEKAKDTFRVTMPMNKTPWMHVDVIPANPGDKGDSYDFYPTTLNHKTFLNVVMVSDDKAHKAYTFLRYEILGDHELHLWKMSPEVAKADVQAGKLKSGVRDEKDSDVSLTDSSATLGKFVQGADTDTLFSEKMEILVRAK